jgi:uncharacterized protein YciI
MAKKRQAKLKEYEVPYEVILRGYVIVEAESEEEAERIAENSPVHDHHFFNQAECVDWEVTSEPKECH